LAQAPERLHEEITADYNDMIYAATREEVEARRKASIRKWHACLRSRACRPVNGTASAPAFCPQATAL